MTTTATRTAKGLQITTPAETVEFNGKRGLSAVAVVVGEWDAAHGGGFNLSLHADVAAALKNANGRKFQTGVQIVKVEG